MEGRYLVYQIRGNAFLWRMVRSIVGTLLELESAGKGPEEAAAALASRDRDRAGTTAPPRGLFLHSIDYGGEHAGDEG
jgi:tRNA pseudouridine38-40 synthase